MTLISKNVYIDKLDDIVHKCHSTIKIKPVDIKANKYINFNKKNKEDPKFEVGDHAKVLKCKDNFPKVYTPNCSDEVFVTKKGKNTVPWTYVISDLNGGEIAWTLYKKGLQKTKKEFIVEKSQEESW